MRPAARVTAGGGSCSPPALGQVQQSLHQFQGLINGLDAENNQLAGGELAQSCLNRLQFSRRFNLLAQPGAMLQTPQQESQKLALLPVPIPLVAVEYDPVEAAADNLSHCNYIFIPTVAAGED